MRRRQLYDLHINSMTYTLFCIPDYQFHKAFYVSLGNNFFTVFLWRPLSLPSLPPFLNPALVVRRLTHLLRRIDCVVDDSGRQH